MGMMTKAAGCAVLFCSSIVSTLAAAQQVIDPVRAAQYFGEAKAASDRDAVVLWGVRLYGPMVFADPQSRTIVANQADSEGKLKREGEVWTGTLPPNVGIANTATKWAGVHWTMIMWGALGQSRQSRVRLMMHESFHRVQDEIGLPATDAVNNHLDTMEGRIWLQLEWRALDGALRSSGVARKQAVADALAFRAHRRRLNGSASDAENALERNEGLAEYTGVRIAGATPIERAEMSEVDLRQAFRRATFVRSFAYMSGPAYGLLLDAVRPGWQRGAKGNFDLGELARQAYLLTSSKPTDADVMARARNYGRDEIIATEKRRDEKRQRELAEARKKFVDGPVLVVKPGEHFNYGFDPNNVVAVDENSTVYPSLNVSDDWGVLKADGGAMLVREKGMIIRLVLPAPTAGATKGDGWDLELKPGWELVPGERKGDVTLSKK
jgi:hypothetical protein